MCSISGFNFQNRELIEKMNEKLKHRGPDQTGIFLDENISLGHRRLSIIDLSERGRQPMFNEDKSLCLIFNGEIYNFEELRSNLKTKGHQFFSNTDSEVILHLFEEHKENCVRFLNGIFAFAVWDIKNKELFLARDRVGVKPLYYYHENGKFIFSSEIKAILEHDIKREINLDALNHYFRLMYVPAPLTMFKNIYKLSQASWLKLKVVSVRGGSNFHNLEIRKYWDVEDFDEIKSKTEIIEKIQDLMRKSVKGQLISDRPVGIFLSGGIDSTSVLGITREFKKDKIKSFSVGFDIEDPNNKFNADLGLARETAKFYNTEHHELLVEAKDILDNLEKVIYHLDEPIAEPTQTATFLLSEIAKKEVAVVLGGDGGDELFGGYKRYYYSYMLNKYLPIIPNFLMTEVYAKFMFQKKEEIGKILNREINNTAITKKFFREKNKNYQAGLAKNFMLVDLNTWLVDESLMRTDKMTMAFGLEQRVPILDHYLVELAAKIPSKYKMADKEHGKKIFIEAMKQYLPEHVLKSDKKKVWLTPMSEWLRRGLNGFAKEVLSADYCPETKKYFDFEGIQKMFDDHIEKRKYNLNLIWALITFQIWCKKYL
ncbi:MAG: asparagine synthase (glutamine-hydrolyzing) [Nanoarchaeota archaeon]|nr:asparagine synthase (glutamine-hydrolyzing) [Nanoarchaeota archaeon]